MPFPFKKTYQNSILLLIGLTASHSLHAKNQPLSDHWEYTADAYLWMPDITGGLANGGDLDISFSDILDNLDMTFMGGASARKGKFTLLGDFIYLDIEDSEKQSVEVLSIPVTTKVDIEMSAWVINLLAGYKLYHDDSFSLDLVGGARYLYIDVSVDAKVDNTGLDVDVSDSVWNGVVGLNGVYSLSDQWFVTGYADIGSGDTKQTHQLKGALVYRMNPWDIVAGYRYIKWDFSKSDDMGKALKDLQISGPYLGARYNF